MAGIAEDVTAAAQQTTRKGRMRLVQIPLLSATAMETLQQQQSDAAEAKQTDEGLAPGKEKTHDPLPVSCI